MKWNHSIRPAALIALAAGGILSLGSAQSAVVANPISGDLFLAFRASDGQGAQTSYLVNIGQDTIYRNSIAGTTIEIGIGDLATDLAATYGSNWSDRADLSWGVFGVRASASSVVYASKERQDAETQSSPWAALDATGRNGTASQISSVIEGTNGYRGREASVNNLFAVFQPNSSAASSYSYQVASAGTTDFGSLSQWGSIEGSFAAGTEGSVLDLYRLSGSTSDPVLFLGSFSLSDSGVLSFTAVPEPASAALAALGLGVVLISRRRPLQGA